MTRTSARPARPARHPATAAGTAPPPRGPAHLARRRRHPTPWALPPRPARPTGSAGPGDGPPTTPVFVDDSGRRRRAGRWIGTGICALVAAYTAVVGLAFAGVPLVGGLAPPGVEQLARSAGDQSVRATPGARERSLPAGAGVAASPDPTAPPVSQPATDTGAADGAATTTPTTVEPSTTTTAPPGNGATTTVPAPSSTVPARPRPGGPPTEPPGRS